MRAQSPVRVLLALLAPVLLLSVSARDSDADEKTRTVVPVKGARFDAQLVELTTERTAVFATADAKRTVALRDLVRWGAPVEPRPGSRVLLADGGWFVADNETVADDKISVESELLGRFAFGLEFCAGVVLQTSLEHQENDRLDNWVRAAGVRTDRLLLENGDELAGRVIKITDTAVEFDVQSRKISVERTRVVAVGFDPSLAARSAKRDGQIWLGLGDGSRLLSTQLATADNKVQFRACDGSQWSAPSSSLIFIQPLDGRVKYLSDLKAETYRYLPLLGQSWPYRDDANVLGTQLRASGQPYAKGIGMHSAARLTYRLDGRYRAFEAEVALDDQVGRGGAVVFAVFVDDKLAWKSECQRGGMPPLPVSVEVAGAKRLSLIVEFAERGDELDRANWLDARLVE